MTTNTELADALDLAIEIISSPSPATRYTCVALTRLAELGQVSPRVAEQVEGFIKTSILEYFTFGSYYRHEINENEYDHVIHQKRIEHMKALSARIRNQD